MHKLTLFTVLALLLTASSRTLSAELSGGANVDRSTTTANASSNKPHRRHNKHTSESAAINRPLNPAGGDDSHKETATGNTDASGMSNSLGNNNSGNPNMGSSDHTPGTSGTSGQ